MTNQRYLIVLMIVAVASVAIGQHKPKLTFRPPAEWFENMQPSMDLSPSYFEQSDQPIANSGPFPDLYIEDYEPEVNAQFFGGDKFVRNPSKEAIFQSLCPTSRRDVILNQEDGEYEYRPASYVEVKCSHPFGRSAHNHQRNAACGDSGYSCIQLNRTIFLTRRAIGTDCWEVETRVIPSNCECMWPKHRKGDILIRH